MSCMVHPKCLLIVKNCESIKPIHVFLDTMEWCCWLPKNKLMLGKNETETRQSLRFRKPVHRPGALSRYSWTIQKIWHRRRRAKVGCTKVLILKIYEHSC